MSLFHQNLETLRRKNRMSQKDLADRFGLSITSVGRWEKTSEARYDILVELSKLFNVSIDTLLTEDLSLLDYQKPLERLAAFEEEGDPYLTEEEMKQLKAMEQALSELTKVIATLTEKTENMAKQQSTITARLAVLESKEQSKK